MGQLTEHLAVGAAYATKIDMGKFDKYKGLFAEEGGFDIPSNFTVGVAFRPTNHWLLALDYERIYYGDAPSVSNPSTLIFNCRRSGGQASALCLGGSNGAGFGWQNVDVWKFGVQYQLNDQLDAARRLQPHRQPDPAAGRDVQHPRAGRRARTTARSARPTRSTRPRRSPARSCTRSTTR